MFLLFLWFNCCVYLGRLDVTVDVCVPSPIFSQFMGCLFFYLSDGLVVMMGLW